MLPTKFQVKWPFGLGEEAKNRFSRWPPWWPSWIFDRKDLSYIWSTSHPMLPTKFQVNKPFSSGEEAKNKFSRWPPWRHLGFLIAKILAIFDLQVIPMLPIKFWVNWPFGSGEEAKNWFSRWWPPWISNRNNFSYFWSTSHPDAFYQVSSQLAPGCRRSRLLKQL